MSSISPSRRQAGLKGTVTCPICEARYTPSPLRQDLLQAPAEVVEAAFMSLCHYCFRCRRPACPQCWDAVHRVCGECVREAQLPFRSETAPLQGTMFPPLASQVGHVEATGGVGTAVDDVIVPLLICVRPGRLQKRIAQAAPTSAPVIAPDVLPQREEVAPSEEEKGQGQIWPVFFRRAERVLNVVLGVILLIVIALVMIAELSATANAQLQWLFHVDIRSEIAYILYVIRQLRW